MLRFMNHVFYCRHVVLGAMFQCLRVPVGVHHVYNRADRVSVSTSLNFMPFTDTQKRAIGHMLLLPGPRPPKKASRYAGDRPWSRQISRRHLENTRNAKTTLMAEEIAVPAGTFTPKINVNGHHGDAAPPKTVFNACMVCRIFATVPRCVHRSNCSSDTRGRAHDHCRFLHTVRRAYKATRRHYLYAIF